MNKINPHARLRDEDLPSACDLCKHLGKKVTWSFDRDEPWNGAEVLAMCNHPDIIKPIIGVVTACEGFKLKVQKRKKKSKKNKNKKKNKKK